MATYIFNKDKLL